MGVKSQYLSSVDVIMFETVSAVLMPAVGYNKLNFLLLIVELQYVSLGTVFDKPTEVSFNGRCKNVISSLPICNDLSLNGL
jgi:hypothetical protein